MKAKNICSFVLSAWLACSMLMAFSMFHAQDETIRARSASEWFPLNTVLGRFTRSRFVFVFQKNLSLVAGRYLTIQVAQLPGAHPWKIAQDDTVQDDTAQDDTAQDDTTQDDIAPIAKGVVYEDRNNNQRFDDADRPLPGVGVSNGFEIVSTDERGQYNLPISDDTILFVIKPSGFKTLFDEQNLPRFYYIHKPHGSPALRYPGVPPTGAIPESINFPLYAVDEPKRFQTILFGDPQPRNLKEVDYMSRDVVADLVGTDAAFGVTLGDILFDNLSIFEDFNQSIGKIGIPWYNVIGNHDINFDAPNRQYSNETFERYYGPTYYSFDYGTVHFVVLDNINWIVPKDEKPHYNGRFGEAQLNFLKADLARIPENQFVVLLMHIPLNNCEDKQDLFRLIEDRPLSFSVSAHRHIHEHIFLTEKDGWKGKQPHHHLINVTVSGSWWSGQKDERGIPHATMPDGAPNGYTILTFDGNDYQLDFVAAGSPRDHQMHISLPDRARQRDLEDQPIHVNVFNGSERSTVEMRWGGEDWTPLEKVNEVDPSLLAQWKTEKEILPAIDPPLSEPKPSSHIWKGKVPSHLEQGTHLVEVRTTDMHGRTFLAHRLIRVTR